MTTLGFHRGSELVVYILLLSAFRRMGLGTETGVNIGLSRPRVFLLPV